MPNSAYCIPRKQKAFLFILIGVEDPFNQTFTIEKREVVLLISLEEALCSVSARKNKRAKKCNSSLHHKGREGSQGTFCHLPLQAFNQCGKKKKKKHCYESYDSDNEAC